MEFIKLTDMNSAYGRAAWEIYEKSFPLFEKRIMEDQEKALLDSGFYPMVAVEENKVIGILFYWQWEECTYLEHLAIDPDCRGQNYGTKILETFCKEKECVVLEIDPPVDEVSIRRLRFYNHLGFIMNDYNHFNLSYRKEDQRQPLKVLSHKRVLSQKEYNFFNESLERYAGKYCQGM